jgi:hypothetical protein
VRQTVVNRDCRLGFLFLLRRRGRWRSGGAVRVRDLVSGLLLLPLALREQLLLGLILHLDVAILVLLVFIVVLVLIILVLVVGYLYSSLAVI